MIGPRADGACTLIDLHCHLLPGLDDGSPDLATSLEMARIAVRDGIETVACTPHIMSGVYDNTATQIRAAIEEFAEALYAADIRLSLVPGADIHMAPEIISDFRSGRLLSLNDTRYFLLEPPHHVVPPRLEDFAFALIAAGYMPVLTHPERLSWIDGHYDAISRLQEGGVLMQLTAGSVTGRFGRRPRYWAERMLDEGKVHLLATDAHDSRRRPPLLAEGRDAVARRLGPEEAERLVVKNPRYILANVLPSDLPKFAGQGAESVGGLWRWARGVGRS